MGSQPDTSPAKEPRFVTVEQHFIHLLEEIQGKLVDLEEVLGKIDVNTKKRPVGRPRKTK